MKGKIRIIGNPRRRMREKGAEFILKITFKDLNPGEKLDIKVHEARDYLIP